MGRRGVALGQVLAFSASCLALRRRDPARLYASDFPICARARLCWQRDATSHAWLRWCRSNRCGLYARRAAPRLRALLVNPTMTSVCGVRCGAQGCPHTAGGSAFGFLFGKTARAPEPLSVMRAYSSIRSDEGFPYARAYCVTFGREAHSQEQSLWSALVPAR